MTEIPYTTEDYKKYVFALAQTETWRIAEIINAVEMDDDSAEDLHCRLDNLMDFAQQAAFMTAEQHVAEEQRRKAEAEARRAEVAARPPQPPLTETEFHELRERLQNHTVDAPGAPAPVPFREPFDPVAIRAHLGVDNSYAHGGPVTTTERFGDADDDYVTFVWHPDPEHPGNQPKAQHEFCRGPGGDGHPWRFGMLEVLLPGSIRVIYEDENNIPEDPELTESQSRILEALRERKDMGIVPSHQDAHNLALLLHMTEQEIIDDEAVLTAHGLIRSPLEHLTEDQQRVLRLLPNVYDVDPTDQSTWGPTTAQLAERLEMSIDEVKKHLRALDKLGWWAPGPPTPEREGAG